MFLYLSVILFMGGVYPSMQWGKGVYPSMQWAEVTKVNKRAVCTSLEYFLVSLLDLDQNHLTVPMYIISEISFQRFLNLSSFFFDIVDVTYPPHWIFFIGIHLEI